MYDWRKVYAADFEIKVTGWVGGSHDKTALPTAPVLASIQPALLQCFYGEKEDDTLCPIAGKTTLASAMMRCCALILLGTVVGLGSAANGQTSAPNQFFVQQFWMWAYDTAVPYASPWYSPCYPFASCAAYRQFQLQERRRDHFAELRREQPSPPPIQLDASRGAGARQVAPTNDADVQPAYVGSGRIREEHRHSGEYLQEFLNRQDRAVR